MKVRFTETRVVDDARKGTEDEERYEDGRVYDLPDLSARRWIDRGVAVEAPAEVSRKAAPSGRGRSATTPRART